MKYMKKENKKNDKSNMGKVVAISAGVAAIAAASYFFFGPKGKKNRKMTQAWMIKMKGDVVEKLETAQDISKEAYDAIVDTAGKAYTTAAGGKEEVAKLAKELKSHWKSISGKAAVKKTRVASKKVKKTK